MPVTLRTTTDNAVEGLARTSADPPPRILVIEPDRALRQRICQGLEKLGYHPDAFESVPDVPWSSPCPWAMVLTGPVVSKQELPELEQRLDGLSGGRPPIRSPDFLSENAAVDGDTGAGTPQEGPTPGEHDAVWSDAFKIQLLRWVADQGPEVLRPVPCPDASLGYAHPRLEKHWNMRPGEAIRVLEDLADFGVLTRRLADRVHLCPACRRWTINFRETCPNCSCFDVDVEELIHHFACAYVGLNSEYRHGTDLRCPKCRSRLNHIGLDYERPRHTYVCGSCGSLFEEPVLTAQCLDCRWEGSSAEVLTWSVYEYDLTDRGREAVERGDLRGLKLREMIHHGRLELASREFLELEVEREAFRMERYGRTMSVLLCRYLLDGVPYAAFRELDRDTLREFTRPPPSASANADERNGDWLSGPPCCPSTRSSCAG